MFKQVLFFFCIFDAVLSHAQQKLVRINLNGQINGVMLSDTSSRYLEIHCNYTTDTSVIIEKKIRLDLIAIDSNFLKFILRDENIDKEIIGYFWIPNLPTLIYKESFSLMDSVFNVDIYSYYLPIRCKKWVFREKDKVYEQEFRFKFIN